MMSNETLTEQSRGTALRFLEHAFNYEFDQAIALLSDDARWWVAGPQDKLVVSGEKNYPQIKKLLTGLAKVMPKGMRYQIRGVTAEGERVAIEVESEGDWHDGRRYNNYYHFLIEMKNGRIHRVREYMDTLHLAELVNKRA